MFVAISPTAMAKGQTPSQTAKAQSAKTPATDAQKKNIQEYIELMRSNVRDQKDEIMGAVMQLNIDDSAKFWPIYTEYDAELTKLNNLRIQNIEEYAREYPQMTDEKADALMQKFQKSNASFPASRQVLRAGKSKRWAPPRAARFIQVEHQLLLIIDLQIASSLPIVGE